MTTAAVLARHGIRRPEITIRAARDAGLELAAACVVLMKESGGGRMVWGSDPVETGGTYRKGGPVTPENYLAYRAAQRAGRIGRQGVGDCQLTSEEYVARAEQLGGPTGPADPYTNQRAGFTGLSRLINAHDTRGGFRRYNGSGPRAEAYADASMAQLATWRARLGAAPSADPTQEVDDVLTTTQAAQLERIFLELTQRLPNRVDFPLIKREDQPPEQRVADTLLGFAINADARAYEAREISAATANSVLALAKAVAGIADVLERVELALRDNGVPTPALGIPIVHDFPGVLDGVEIQLTGVLRPT